MTDWWTKIVVGEGNVIRERSLTNWNTFDDSEVVAGKEKPSVTPQPEALPVESTADGDIQKR
jgi:hypothetical protein